MADPVSRAVLVTGWPAGLGRATAERLAARGYTVYATARRPEAISDLEARGCRVLALDVTDEESMQAAATTVHDEHGAVGRLANPPRARRGGRPRPQRGLQPVRRRRGGADGGGSPPVRDQHLRPRADVPARAA